TSSHAAWRGRARRGLPASYPAGSSSTLSSLARGRSPPPAGHFSPTPAVEHAFATMERVIDEQAIRRALDSVIDPELRRSIGALPAVGKRVGVLDADVWGYSIPRMYGLGSTRPPVSAERKIVPLEAHGVKVMSIGFFVEEDAAVVWRGPMLHKALTQFLQDVE